MVSGSVPIGGIRITTSPSQDGSAVNDEITGSETLIGKLGKILWTFYRKSLTSDGPFACSEVELLLEQAEFVVKDVCGDYSFGSYGLESPPVICITEARWPVNKTILSKREL